MPSDSIYQVWPEGSSHAQPDLPRSPHATGRWAKKIRGKLHYSCPWDDPDTALKNALIIGGIRMRFVRPGPRAIDWQSAVSANGSSSASGTV